MISAVSKRVDIIAQGKAQLERLEAMRKLFTKSRALSLAQRALLYAKDELEMCTMRMRVSLSSNFEGACGQWHGSSLAKFVLSLAVQIVKPKLPIYASDFAYDK